MPKTETKYCWACETKLTPENTQSYEGFDEGNYKMSLIYSGGQLPKESFQKCDACFDSDIDNYLENLYN
jgi:hypothetical protein